MGQINFARVDARLVHGQITTAWSNSVGINAIYVVDNPTASDDFTKMIYENLEKNYSFKINVYTVEEVAALWEENQFGDHKVLLLFKDVDHALKTREAGVTYDALNVGGVPQKADRKVVADSVALTELEFNQLKELESEHGMEVYFQTLPSSSKKKLSAVKY